MAAVRTPGTAQFRIKEGDSLPFVVAVLERRRGDPIRGLEHLDTVQFQLLSDFGAMPTLDELAALTDEDRAEVTYDWSGGPAGPAGTYYGQFVLTFDNGAVLTVPNADDGEDLFIVEITE